MQLFKSHHTLPLFSSIYTWFNKIKMGPPNFLTSMGIWTVGFQSAHLHSRNKSTTIIGLKADPDEKIYSASLPVLIRSLLQHCHPHWTTLTQAVAHTASLTHLDRQRYLLVSAHSRTHHLCASFVLVYVFCIHIHPFVCLHCVCVYTSTCAYLVPGSPPALSRDKKRDLGTSILYIW